jgi:hypothetical protein
MNRWRTPVEGPYVSLSLSHTHTHTHKMQPKIKNAGTPHSDQVNLTAFVSNNTVWDRSWYASCPVEQPTVSVCSMRAWQWIKSLSSSILFLTPFSKIIWFTQPSLFFQHLLLSLMRMETTSSSEKCYGVTTQKIPVQIFVAVKTSDLTYLQT